MDSSTESEETKKMFKFLCRHNRVRVIRWHPDILPESWKDKILYVDDKGDGIINLVCCDKCGKILDTNQKERLYAQVIE